MTTLIATIAPVLLSASLAATRAPLPEYDGWFEGDYNAALVLARESNRFVLLDFWTEWCTYCKKLDRETFADPSAHEELRSLVALRIDAESPGGSKVAQRFEITSYPALIVLRPDGSAEDHIGGYLDAPAFVAAMQRVRRGEGTRSDLERRVTATPEDLELTYRLAIKLRLLGEGLAAERYIAEIERRDPEAQSLVMQTILAERERAALGKVVGEMTRRYELDQKFEPEPVENFLATVSVGQVRFEGWLLMSNIYEPLGYAARARSAKRKAWADCPEDLIGSFGNQLAWDFYEAELRLSDEEKAFALSVAQRAAALTPNEPDVLDTVACCYRMNGDLARAIELAERCVQLAPDDPDWRERVAELHALRDQR